jgi:hypothetical protein
MEPYCALMKGILILVRLLDIIRNQFETRMHEMYEKLARLDLVMIKGEVAYIPHEEVQCLALNSPAPPAHRRAASVHHNI